MASSCARNGMGLRGLGSSLRMVRTFDFLRGFGSTAELGSFDFGDISVVSSYGMINTATL
ncbi:hypothetical protein [Helicobacter mustelae]|uniref:hypothetical protein n=1 Tax=Helicobacter mustelae TaxID=217 RepID=UPI0011C06AD0|nr:hypothetical protein [Helicobacter mustelae]